MRRNRPRMTYREVALLSFAAIFFPLEILFNLVQRQSVSLYRCDLYGLAFVVALVLPWYLVWKGPPLAQLALGSALFFLFGFGLILGSFTGASALIEGLHQPNDRLLIVIAVFVVWGAYQCCADTLTDLCFRYWAPSPNRW
jgi:hypothetical protein